jgi:hypothetical protein
VTLSLKGDTIPAPKYGMPVGHGWYEMDRKLVLVVAWRYVKGQWRYWVYEAHVCEGAKANTWCGQPEKDQPPYVRAKATLSKETTEDKLTLGKRFKTIKQITKVWTPKKHRTTCYLENYTLG